MTCPPQSTDVDDSHLALLICGAAVWMQRDLMKRLPRLPRADRELLATLAQRIERQRLETLALIVTPDTLRRWYRQLVIAKWTHPPIGTPGRPPIDPAVAALAVCIARENPGMGSPGVARRLSYFGHAISASTVRRILRAHGIDPQPVRDHDRDWATFLEAHADQIAAIDFTTVETVERDGSLTTRYALFAIHHNTRRVHLIGITTHPTGDWMAQQARNLTDAFDGFLSRRRFCIMDRDGSFSERFRSILANAGVRPIRTPPQSPNCNAFMERFFSSIKQECLRRIIPLGEIGLRHAIQEYLTHYHTERPHQGLDGAIIDPSAANTENATSDAPVICTSRLGRILRHYQRIAA